MIFAYADPPYVGQAKKLYREDEIDHAELIGRLASRDVMPLRISPWMKYAYHIGRCAAIADRQPWNLSNLPEWSTHDAYVLDQRCDCGLRDLVEAQTTDTTWKWVKIG